MSWLEKQGVSLKNIAAKGSVLTYDTTAYMHNAAIKVQNSLPSLGKLDEDLKLIQSQLQNLSGENLEAAKLLLGQLQKIINLMIDLSTKRAFKDTPPWTAGKRRTKRGKRHKKHGTKRRH